MLGRSRWQSSHLAPTAGCTAMAEPVMQELLRWLDPQHHPVFVLLPRAEYDRLAHDWRLPERAP